MLQNALDMIGPFPLHDYDASGPLHFLLQTGETPFFHPASYTTGANLQSYNQELGA